MKSTETKWYATWFDTEFYHTLYKHRNFEEARHFMNALTSAIHLDKNAHILDVACGRGRHAIYLNKLGFQVTGIDLSPNNIKFAKTHETSSLEFKVHDMCEPMAIQYDAVFNLFTSFGYFEDDADNLKAIKTMAKNLKQEGTGVIDFLNINKTLKTLKTTDTKNVDGIEFKIEKWVEDGHIIKQITFNAEKKDFQFQEKLKCLDLNTFENYFDKANLKILNTYGDYNLNPFDILDSDRLIMTFVHQ
jgi:2-polyprenyl-3-methyl-5-hydroxy-6-metoxy-1,4-benzoquinol methylase